MGDETLIKPSALMAANADNFYYFDANEICISQFTIVIMYTLLSFMTICFFSLGSTIIASKRSSLEAACIDESSEDEPETKK